MLLRVEHLGLMAEDTEKLASWYEQVLGFRVIYRNKKEPPTFFVGGEQGSMIEILPRPKGTAASAEQEKQGFHIAIEVEDFEQAIADLRAKGVVFDGEAKEASGGVRLIVMQDPEGNQIQLIYRPNPFK